MRRYWIVAGVFILSLLVQNRCDLFCYDDPYSYWQVLVNGGQELTTIPGAPIYLMFKAFSLITINDIWAIKIVAALISTVFFILMWKILKERVNYALFFALAATFSFWWLEISMQLFKNELAMIFLLYAVFFGESLLVLSALIHASTGIFAGVIALSKFKWFKDNRVIVLMYLLLLVLSVRTLSGSQFVKDYGTSTLLETVFIVIMLPVVFYGYDDNKPHYIELIENLFREPKLDMRPYMFASAFCSIIFMFIGIEYAWRFLLMSMPFVWIAFAEGFEKARKDKHKIMFSLGLWVIMVSILAGLLMLYASNPLFTYQNVDSAKQIVELHPPSVFLNDSARIFDNLLRIEGYKGSINYSNCSGSGLYVSKLNGTIRMRDCLWMNQ